MIIYYRKACSIPLGDHVVITGGFWSRSKVVRYGEAGWERDLPSLNTGREEHGCTAFMSEGQQVRLTT